MLSIKRCTEILNKAEKKYSKDEIKLINEILTQLAELEVKKFVIENSKKS